MSVPPNLIYRFSTTAIKIPAIYFVDSDKLILKFVWRGKRPRRAITTILKKYKLGGLTLLNFKTYYETATIKRVWYWQKCIQVYQWNRTDCPEINLHKYSQLIFGKGAKAIQWNKESFQQRSWNNWTSACERMNLGIDLKPLTKINSTWITDLNAKCKALKLLEDNVGENLDY